MFIDFHWQLLSIHNFVFLANLRIIFHLKKNYNNQYLKIETKKVEQDDMNYFFWEQEWYVSLNLKK